MRSCASPVELADFAAGKGSSKLRGRIEQHLAECGGCRVALERVSGAQLAMRAIAELPAPTLSPAGAARLEAALRWSRPMPTARLGFFDSWQRRAALGFATASVAAGAFLLLRPRHPAPARSAAPVMAVKSPTVVPVHAPPQKQGLLAVVTLLGGDVRLAHDGAERPLDLHTELRASDGLATGAGGRVAFQWGEGSGALLSGGSQLKLAVLEPTAQELRLARGRVSVRVGPHQPGESMRVITPGYSVTVHGTWFVIGADTRGTTVEVLEGVVEVSRSGGGEATRLPAPMRAFFALDPSSREVARDERPLSAKEAASMRLVSEMGLLPWASDGGATGIAALLGQSGPITIEADPPAQVAVDGVNFGSSPLQLRRGHGRHLVELARVGFHTMSRWVAIGDQPGEVRAAMLPSSEPKADEEVAPSVEEVQTVIHLRSRQVRHCYDHGLKLDPTLSGTVTLQFRVGGAGQVLASKVENDTLTDPTVAQCLRREVAGWSFGHARNATIYYPFVFRSQ